MLGVLIFFWGGGVRIVCAEYAGSISTVITILSNSDHIFELYFFKNHFNIIFLYSIKS